MGYVITASAGLIPCETLVTLQQLVKLCAGDVDIASEKYRVPLDPDANELSDSPRSSCEKHSDQSDCQK